MTGIALPDSGSVRKNTNPGRNDIGPGSMCLQRGKELLPKRGPEQPLFGTPPNRDQGGLCP